MPKKKIDEKSLLYKLCEFLKEKRIETKGINTPVKISAEHFLKRLGEFSNHQSDEKKWSEIDGELNSLLQEENERGEKLIRVVGEEIPPPKKTIAEPKKGYIFIYRRTDIEYYIKDLKAGDSIKAYWERDSKIKIKITKEFKIIDQYFIFDTLFIPVQDKQEKLATLFLKNAEKHKPGKTSTEGVALSLQQIKETVGYESEKNARTGKKELKKKINETWEKSQIEIKRAGPKLFKMVINY